jgi:hypothetical protein
MLDVRGWGEEINFKTSTLIFTFFLVVSTFSEIENTFLETEVNLVFLKAH